MDKVHEVQMTSVMPVIATSALTHFSENHVFQEHKM